MKKFAVLFLFLLVSIFYLESERVSGFSEDTLLSFDLQHCEKYNIGDFRPDNIAKVDRNV